MARVSKRCGRKLWLQLESIECGWIITHSPRRGLEVLPVSSLPNPAPGEGSVPTGLFFPWLSFVFSEGKKRTELSLDLLETLHPQARFVPRELKSPSDFSGLWGRALFVTQLEPTLELEISQTQRYLPKF